MDPGIKAMVGTTISIFQVRKDNGWVQTISLVLEHLPEKESPKVVQHLQMVAIITSSRLRKLISFQIKRKQSTEHLGDALDVEKKGTLAKIALIMLQ